MIGAFAVLHIGFFCAASHLNKISRDRGLGGSEDFPGLPFPLGLGLR
jgi:hypothetical protein